MKDITPKSHAPAKTGYAPSELNVRGGAVPPVSPEVIKILLFQRSCRLMDAPSEHIISKESCDGSITVILLVISRHIRAREFCNGICDPFASDSVCQGQVVF